MVPNKGPRNKRDRESFENKERRTLVRNSRTSVTIKNVFVLIVIVVVVVKNGPLWDSFSLFSSVLQLTEHTYSVLKFANAWIRTLGPLLQKRPLCQLSHNHCPNLCCYLTLPLSSSGTLVGKLILQQNSFDGEQAKQKFFLILASNILPLCLDKLRK